MSARVAWTGGGEATIESLDEKAIVLRSTVPWPPGSRPDGALAASGGSATAGAEAAGAEAAGAQPAGAQPAAPARVRVKVHACKKQPEGDYRIEGRPIDMPREVRDRIASSG